MSEYAESGIVMDVGLRAYHAQDFGFAGDYTFETIGQPLPMLLDGINRVLPAVKEPNMYATLAGLRFSDSSEVEYTLAGHLPLLRYQQLENNVIRRSMEQFPLGMFAATTYVSKRVNSGPGDLFALVTDGLVETSNETEEEFGLDRLEQLLQKYAARPLHEIFGAVLAAVADHGAQQDDRTLLLVRVLR
jgi:serine phosphatase RsbU (regulator of sigma subunit)